MSETTAPPDGSEKQTTNFLQRRLDATITLQPTTNMQMERTGTPTFVESGTNQLTVSGHRMSASLKNAGGFAMGEMQLRIFGLSLSLMNQLSTLGRIPLAGRNNTVSLSAGDDVNGMSVAFTGTITNAWADFKGMPDVAFHITAVAGMQAMLSAVPPSSFRGSSDVATIMASLAQQMGLAFENAGVQSRLANPYFPGTLYQQARACAEAAGISMTIDRGTLVIVPRGGVRGGRIPLISPATGLVGYPGFTANGIALTTIYNPSISIDAVVKVESELTPACGNWRVYNVSHELEADQPGGAWFTALEAGELQFTPARTR